MASFSLYRAGYTYSHHYFYRTTWQKSLDSFQKLDQEVKDIPQLSWLGVAGCVRVSVFVQWLAYWTGDYELHEKALKLFNEYAQRIEQEELTENSELLLLASSVILGTRGYKAVARQQISSIIERCNELIFDVVYWLED